MTLSFTRKEVKELVYTLGFALEYLKLLKQKNLDNDFMYTAEAYQESIDETTGFIQRINLELGNDQV